MPRLALLVLSAALAGCTTTTHLVDRTYPVSMNRTHRALAGETATLGLSTGEQALGRIQAVQTDSVVWEDNDLRRAAPTADVYTITMDNRWRSVGKGALIGAGVGGALAVALVLSPSQAIESEEDIVFGVAEAVGRGILIVAATPVGAVYGTIGGAIAGRRIEYVFTGGPPRPPR